MQVEIPIRVIRSDWAYMDTVTIETDDFDFFELEVREPETGWYLIGKRYDYQTQRYSREEYAIPFEWQMVRIFHELKDHVKKIDVVHDSSNQCLLAQFFEEYSSYVRSLEYGTSLIQSRDCL